MEATARPAPLVPQAASRWPRSDAMRTRLDALKPGAGVIGGLLAVVGLSLVWLPSLWWGALGLELLAAGFWYWARAAVDREEQLQRWSWLRRPAAAMWLAAAAGEVLRLSSVVSPAPPSLTALV